jgi:hypothetical protein
MSSSGLSSLPPPTASRDRSRARPRVLRAASASENTPPRGEPGRRRRGLGACSPFEAGDARTFPSAPQPLTVTALACFSPGLSVAAVCFFSQARRPETVARSLARVGVAVSWPPRWRYWVRFHAGQRRLPSRQRGPGADLRSVWKRAGGGRRRRRFEHPRRAAVQATGACGPAMRGPSVHTMDPDRPRAYTCGSRGKHHDWSPT